jgi:hypothetical protein
MPAKKKPSKKTAKKSTAVKKKPAKKKVAKKKAPARKRLQKRKGKQFKPPSRVDVREFCTENAFLVAQCLFNSIPYEGNQQIRPLAPEQIQACRILLGKTVPDVKSVEAVIEHKGGTPIVVEFL